MRWLPVILLAGELCAVGCTDIFALPPVGSGGDDSGGLGNDGDVGDGGSGDDSGTGDDGGDGGDGSMLALPASCATLPCTPATNEGVVFLSDGDISGCH